MKTLKEVSELVGMSRRVIQEYEKAGVADTPTTRNKYGYLLYDQSHIERLWKIRFYRELGYEKKQILAILEDPDYDQQKELEDKILRFQKKRLELDKLITMAQTAEQTGITLTNIRSSVPGLQNASYDFLSNLFSTGIQIMGKNMDILEDMLQQISEEDLDKAFLYIQEIIDLAEEDYLSDSPQVQQQVLCLHQTVSRKLSESIQVLSWCSLLLAPGTPFAGTINEVFWPGASDFVYQALQFYCRNAKDNPADRLLIESLTRIENMGKEKYAAASQKVQQEVQKVHRFFAGIRILSPENQLRMLKILGMLYRSIGSQSVSPQEQDPEFGQFVADAILIYCQHLKNSTKEEPQP